MIIGKNVEKKLDKFEAIIKNVLEVKLEENATLVEGRVTKLVNDKTYAESVSNKIQDCDKIIIKAAKNDDLAEKQQREIRSVNQTIHGMGETTDGTTTSDSYDKQFVASFLETIGVEVNPKTTFRLGKPNEKKKRPLKFVMNSSSDQDLIMSKLGHSDDRFRNLSLTDDYTNEEQGLIKELVNKSKQMNEEEKPKSFKYRVRASPKKTDYLGENIHQAAINK